MTPVRVLVDSFADKDLPNAQMGNAREIIRRLDPARFHVSVFVCGEPDTSIAQRPNTRLIPLPSQRQTARIFREFVSENPRILRRNAAREGCTSARCGRSQDHNFYSMTRHAFPTPIIASLARGQWRQS